MGQFKENDPSYIFTFEKAPGFTAFYKVKADGHYMSYDSSTSWRIISQTASPTDKNGYIQVERLENGNANLRCVWQNSLLVGLNAKSVGSYIYADKTTPAEFILEDIEEEADGIHSIDNGQLTTDNGVYDLSGRKVNGQLRRGVYITNGKKKLYFK